MSQQDPISYAVVSDDLRQIEQGSTQELRQGLEKGNDEVKLETLRRIVVATLNGNPQPNLLMPIIQYVLPSRNKQIKKMLAFYWEVCPKLDENGKLKQEMILVCNAIRNDLQHPNEYIRGGTLRAVQKIHEAELLEPLVPTVRSCMEHRHAYVRKNAVFTVLSIYKNHEHLIPDAPELLLTFLAAESDATCKRNAFVSLCTIAQPRAVEYLLSILDTVPSLDELFQLAIIDLVRREARTSPSDGPHRAKWIRTIFELLTATSGTVKYEAATSLTSLTQNPAAVKAAASCFVDLCVKESDNNVKLIVLDRLDALREKHERVLDPLVTDVLRVLGSNDMAVKRKTMRIALEMVSSRNVEDVVSILKKQLANTVEESQYEKNLEYRQLLIQSIHTCAIRFSEVAASVVHVLMEFIGDSGNSSAVDVIAFVREVVQRFPKLRSSITEKLLDTLGNVKSGKVFRGALWIVGEYCTETEDIQAAFRAVRKIIGEVPILASEQRLLDEAEAEEPSVNEHPEHKPSTTTRVLADGTYATETVYSSTVQEKEKIAKIRAASKAPLRALLLAGDFFTGSVLASTLTKLVLRFHEISPSSSTSPQANNALRAEAMLIMASIVRVGQSKFTAVPIDEDSQERILNCVQTLAKLESSKPAKEIFLEDTRRAYGKMVGTAERKAKERKEKEDRKNGKGGVVQPDELISFRQFSKKVAGTEADEYEADLVRATGSTDVKSDFLSKLSRVVQLTGFSDPVYAEAYVHVNQFDVLLEVLIVNQTPDTLQNLSVEFATLGDLKLLERPTPTTLGPHAFHSIKATVKVASTDTGVIFGNISYDASAHGGTGGASTDQSKSIVLSDIHVDIMDYIKPAYCNEAKFRAMWTEFEWENKVAVVTDITSLRGYLQHILASTNMACLTAEAALSGDCDFLSANCYARSLFGEDGLANLSIEKLEDGTVQGHVRIRSKTQGLALQLGDAITLKQKSFASDSK